MVPVNTIAPSAGAPPVVDRVATTPVVQAVATELSPAKSVTAVGTAQPARSDVASSAENYQHTVILDPATQDLIFRVIDVRSRQVVRQVPDEALLRMRAYSRALAEGKGTNEAWTAANLEV
jgi:uncharacterized FlaG/YvyC family protein